MKMIGDLDKGILLVVGLGALVVGIVIGICCKCICSKAKTADVHPEEVPSESSVAISIVTSLKPSESIINELTMQIVTPPESPNVSKTKNI